MAFITGADRNQIVMFPECMDDYISEDSVVRVIDEYIETLDMNKLGFKRAVAASLGRPPYNDKDLAKLYV
jgi:transposase